MGVEDDGGGGDNIYMCVDVGVVERMDGCAVMIECLLL